MKRAHAQISSADAQPGADTLECTICLHQLKEPSTLQCGHTYCRECVLGLPGVRAAVGQGEDAEVTCPLCRREVFVACDVPVNTVMREMLERLAQAERSRASLVLAMEIPAHQIARLTEIGRGAMATVFAGTWDRRPVALKVIAPAALGAAAAHEAAIKRLRHEAAILSMARHPSVLQFYGVVLEAGGGVTLVMERADTSLRALLAERRLTLDECMDLGEQMLGALAHLHSRNIVHGNVKPSNVLVFRGEGGRLQFKLANFGIAFAGAASSASAEVGTVAYMAPEILRDESRPDFAADVYAAAVVLNEALAGEVPFAGMRIGQALRRIVAGQHPKLATEGVPPAVQMLVQRMWGGRFAERLSAEDARRTLVALVSSSFSLSEMPFPPRLRMFTGHLTIRFQSSATVLSCTITKDDPALYEQVHSRPLPPELASVPNTWDTFKNAFVDPAGGSVAYFNFHPDVANNGDSRKWRYLPQLAQGQGVVSFRARASTSDEWIDVTQPDPVVRLQDGGTLLAEAVLEHEAPILPRNMQVFVKTLTGGTLYVTANQDMLAIELKEMIQVKDGVPVNQQRLVFGGRELEDYRTLRDRGIKKESIIHMVLKLRGD